MAKKEQITSEEYEALQEEFMRARERYKKAVGDKSEAHRISGDPDMHEDAGAEEAYRRMNMWAGRMEELSAKLRNVEIIRAPMSKEKVQIGCTVTLMIEKKETLTLFMAGPRGRMDKGHLASISPVGAAVLGKKVGFEANVSTPGGSVHVRIIAIE